MSYTIVARDPITGKVKGRYRKSTGEDALAMVALLHEKGLEAALEEQGIPPKRKNPKRTRKNIAPPLAGHISAEKFQEAWAGEEPPGLRGQDLEDWWHLTQEIFAAKMDETVDRRDVDEHTERRLFELAAGEAERIVRKESERVRRNPRARRKNPGELLILSGFVANPAPKTLVKDHDAVEADDAFREFHDGADPGSIITLPEDAMPPRTKHLFSLGELVGVIYQVPPESGKAPGPPFQHLFGEVGRSSKVVKKNRPLLCGTTDGKYLIIVHRNKPGTKATYRVRPEGIVG